MKNIFGPVLMLVSALTLSFYQKAIILNKKTNKLNKTIKKKKHLSIINVLKKFVKAIIIINYILNLKINLTVNKLLASALIFKKQFIRAITKNKTMQF